MHYLFNSHKRIVIVLLAIFFSGCLNESPLNLSVYKFLGIGLYRSNHIISNQTLEWMHSLEEKLIDPQTKEKAIYWNSRAVLIRLKTKKMVRYIDSLKIELKKASGSSIVDGKEQFREGDVKVVIDFFEKQNNAEKLRTMLAMFKNDMLTIDPEITANLENMVNTTLRLSDPDDPKRTFTDTFFKNIPALASLTVLFQFENDVRIVENKLVGFCANKVPSIDHAKN